MEIKKVLVRGYGTITKGVIRNILDNDHSIDIYVFTSKSHLDEPVTIVSDFEEIPSNLDAIVSCLPSDIESKAFWYNPKLQTLIRESNSYCLELSTLSKDYVIEWSNYIKNTNGKPVEIPCTGSKKGAEKGALSLFFVGDEEIIPFLNLFSAQVYQFANPGEATKFKLLYNLWGGVMLYQLAEFLPIIENEFSDIEQVVKIFSSDKYAWMAPISSSKMEQALRKDYDDVNFKFGYMVKDIEYALKEFANYDVPVSKKVLDIYAEKCGTDTYDKDFTIITKKDNVNESQ